MAQIVFQITSGDAPFDISLSPNVGKNFLATSIGIHFITGLSLGSYTITIIDALGCVVIKSVDLLSENAVSYGLLYNWFAVNDSRKITSSNDWTVISGTQMNALRNYIDPAYVSPTNNVAGTKMKSSGTTYWNTAGGTNYYGFNGRGAGRRASIGTFSGLKTNGSFWTSTGITAANANIGQLYDNQSYFYFDYDSVTPTNSTLSTKKTGASVRLLKSAVGVSDGTKAVYTGNDGKNYNAIAINQVYVTIDNLAETEYRDGSPIPEVTDNTEWLGLSTGALCAYNNDWNYVGFGYTDSPYTTTTTP